MTVSDVSAGAGTAAYGLGRLSASVDGCTVEGVLRPGTRLARIVDVDRPTAAAIRAFVAAASARGCVSIRVELPVGSMAMEAFTSTGFHAVHPVVHAAQPTRPVRRLERRIAHARTRSLPYFAQTTWFTCGPVALMLAGSRLGTGQPVDRRSEVAFWREATTVHAPAGPGGCEPFGVACAAARRGLPTRIVTSIEGPFLMDRAADPGKRDLMLFVQSEFRAEARDLGVAVEIREWTHRDLTDTIAAGGVAIVLIDQMTFQGEAMPHWVLVHGAGDGLYWIDDPWVDEAAGETDTDKFEVPVPVDEFDRMAWWGRSPYRAAVLIGRPGP